MDASGTSSPVTSGADQSADLPVQVLLDGFDTNAGSQLWVMLGQVWSALGADLWSLIPDGRGVFAAIPDSAADRSISLREMRASARAESGGAGGAVSQDAALMASLTEKPALEPGDDDGSAAALRDRPMPDEIATNVVHAVRRAREFGAYREASAIAARGLGRLKELEECGQVPTPRNYVRVLMEGGRTEFSIGDFGRATAMSREAARAATEQLPRESSLLTSCIAWNRYIRVGAGLDVAELGSSSEARGASDGNLAWSRGLPPTITTRAIGALNHLELECPSFDALNQLVASPSGDVAAAAALVSLERDLMLGDQARASLTLDRCISAHGPTLREAVAVSGAIASARLGLLLHAGHAYRVASLMMEMRTCGPQVRAVDTLRFTLAIGNYERVENLANSALADPYLSVAEKAGVYALKAASLLASGRGGDAHREFRTALRASGMAGTLLTIVHVPALLRDELVAETADAPEWEDIEIALDLDRSEAIRRITRCRTYETDLVLPDLTHKDVKLLVCVDAAQSVAEVAHMMSIASGTARNSLSALYRKLGVAGWKDAVAHAYRHGILPATSPLGAPGELGPSAPPSSRT